MSYVLVGLGNPDEKYNNTRHNTGRMALDYFQQQKKFSEWKLDKELKGLIAKGVLGKEKVVLLKPETFMNKSGLAVKKLVTSVKKAEKLVVIYDELDLPLGTFKISYNRGSGGHNGVESIIRSVGTKGFIRVRIGITPATASGKLRKPKGEDAVVDHILGEFKKSDLEQLSKVFKKVSEALEMIVVEGRDVAMGTYN